MTHSFAAFISYHKYELGIPFEHLSRHLKETLDIEISKQNLAFYMAKVASVLKLIRIVRKAMCMSIHRVITIHKSRFMTFMNREQSTARQLGYRIMKGRSYVMTLKDIRSSRKTIQTSNCKGASRM